VEDYYAILGVSSNSDQDAIKTAFRVNARKWHPDHNLDNKEEATQRFAEVSKAWSVLGDPRKRQIYNHQRHAQRALQGHAPRAFRSNEVAKLAAAIIGIGALNLLQNKFLQGKHF